MFTLILFIYAGVMSKGDSVALVNAGDFKTESACVAAGKKSEDLVKSTFKDTRFVCLKKD